MQSHHSRFFPRPSLSVDTILVYVYFNAPLRPFLWDDTSWPFRRTAAPCASIIRSASIPALVTNLPNRRPRSLSGLPLSGVRTAKRNPFYTVHTDRYAGIDVCVHVGVTNAEVIRSSVMTAAEWLRLTNQLCQRRLRGTSPRLRFDTFGTVGGAPGRRVKAHDGTTMFYVLCKNKFVTVVAFIGQIIFRFMWHKIQ